MADSRPIGIFDSGIGGLPIAQQIRSLLPAEDLIYVADTFYAPYGEKTEAEILDRAIAVTAFLLTQQVKAIVVACNTATMIAIKTLRERYELPFIGVEPGVKPAAMTTKTGVIGVMATSKTLVSQAFTELALRVASHVRVEVQACPDLVTTIEALQLDAEQARPIIERYLQPLLAKGADTIILGCTHFSHLKPVIQSIAGDSVTVISTEQAVAKETQRRLLQVEGLASTPEKLGQSQFYSNGDTVLFEQQIARLWGQNKNVGRFK